jgi:KDO2-lipid IV(A) lauroyltransferase
MRILYVIADCIYFLMYYILDYRKKVVMSNLLIAFPEKTDEERVHIAKQFYLNFIDSFVEFVKLLSANDEFLKKRFTLNAEGLNELYKTGKACQVHLGHTFNWEWGQLVLNLVTPYKVMVVYMPVANTIFEKLSYRLRTRNGSIFLPSTSMRAAMEPHIDTQYLLGLVVDQSPSNLQSAYWLNFFGRPTAFIAGPEKAARLKGLPVAFAYIEKPRRGYYNAVIEIASEDSSLMHEGDLTLKYSRYLEQVIRRNPSMWLWSHRRWKHEWKDEFIGRWIDEQKPLQR